MTEPECRQLIAMLASAYPNQTITSETVAVYCGMLADLDANVAASGVKALLAESKFFPTIAEIRAATLRSTDDIASGAVAWGEVMGQVKAVGIYGRPEWSSETIQRAVRAVGWEQICQCELDQLNTLRSQFMRIYDAYHGHVERERNLGSLTGERIPERLPTGTEGAEPRRIGDIIPIRRKP